MITSLIFALVINASWSKFWAKSRISDKLFNSKPFNTSFKPLNISVNFSTDCATFTSPKSAASNVKSTLNISVTTFVINASHSPAWRSNTDTSDNATIASDRIVKSIFVMSFVSKYSNAPKLSAALATEPSFNIILPKSSALIFRSTPSIVKVSLSMFRFLIISISSSSTLSNPNLIASGSTTLIISILKMLDSANEA